MDRHRHAIDRRLQRVKGTDGGGGLLGLALQAQGQFGDDPKRALGPHEQRRQIIARAGFRGPRAGADDPPVGQHHLQGQHIVPHRAIAHGGRAAGPRRGHPPKAGIGAGIDGKEQLRGAQIGVQRLARDAGLDAGLHVGGPHLQHPVHARQVQRDAAPAGQRMPLQRSTGAPGDDRHRMLRTGAQDGRHLFGAIRPDHRIGRRAAMKAFRRRMLIAIAALLRKPRAQKGVQRSDQRGRQSLGLFRGQRIGKTHGISLWQGRARHHPGHGMGRQNLS
ncbi:hypothetical protein PANO111632_20785 [Paracoccus nototheniae]